MGWLTNALLKLIWSILCEGELQLIHAFDSVFRYLTSGVFYDVLFGGKDLSDGFNHHVPFAFWAFWIVAAFMVIVIFIIQYFLLMFQEDNTTGKRLLTALKNTAKGAGISIIMPAAFFLGIYMIDFLQNVILSIFNADKNGMASMLYKIGDSSWDGTSVGNVPSSFKAPSNIGDYNMITEILAIWFIMYAYAMVALAVAAKVFELYCLFIIGPLFAATYTMDGGIRFKKYKDSVLGKLFVSVGTILVFESFIVIMSVLLKVVNGVNSPFSTSFEKMLFELAILLGGGTYIQTMPSFFANFIGEAAGMAEGKNAMRQGIAGARMLKAGATGIMGAIGIGAASKISTGGKGPNKAGTFAAAAQNAGLNRDNTNGKRRGGLLGMAGKGLRLGSSLVLGASTLGMAAGLTGKERGRNARRGMKEHVKNVSNRRWNEFKNNATFGNRHTTERQKFYAKYAKHKNQLAKKPQTLQQQQLRAATSEQEKHNIRAMAYQEEQAQRKADGAKKYEAWKQSQVNSN